MQITEKDIFNEIKILADFQRFARLAQDLKLTGKISEDSIVRAQQIMFEFGKLCVNFNVNIVAAVATSAMREAVNAKQVAKKLENSFNVNYNRSRGVKIKIISSDIEAELTHKGSCTDNEDNKSNTIIDIGGGSTEIISSHNGNIIEQISIPIGVVKLTEKLNIIQPVSDYKVSRVRKHIKMQLEQINQKNHKGNIIAVSGTPVALAMIHLNLFEYDANKINNFIFNRKEFQNIINKILNLELDVLINKLKIKKYRADVLAAGALLLDEIIEYFGKDTFTVNTNGLRYGLALQLFEEKNIKLDVQL